MSSDSENVIQHVEETLLAYCRQQGLFKSGDRVIAACSGGADSMALLLFFCFGGGGTWKLKFWRPMSITESAASMRWLTLIL